MRVVPLTDYQKIALRQVIDLLVRLRLPSETRDYCPAWKIQPFRNAHGEVRVEYEEMAGGQAMRFAVYVSPTGTLLWRSRGKEEARWKRKLEIIDAEYMPRLEGI